MRALKGLVIGMGVVILIGFAVVVVALIERAERAPSTPAQSAPSTVQRPSPGVFGDVAVALPLGAQVVGTATDAGRLIVHLRLADGNARVLVIDLATGRRLGAIRLVPEDIP